VRIRWRPASGLAVFSLGLQRPARIFGHFMEVDAGEHTAPRLHVP
jgi:hypothetical protein